MTMTLDKIMTSDWTITRTSDDYYRYVNHDKHLLTVGFGTEPALIRNTNIIRIDAGTIRLMTERYEGHYQR